MDLSGLRLALIDERAYLVLDQRRVHVEKSSIEPNLYRITTLEIRHVDLNAVHLAADKRSTNCLLGSVDFGAF